MELHTSIMQSFLYTLHCFKFCASLSACTCYKCDCKSSKSPTTYLLFGSLDTCFLKETEQRLFAHLLLSLCLLLSILKSCKAAVQIREDMKKMVQLPMLKPWPASAAATVTGGQKVFGISLLEMRELGLLKDGVPLVVRSMVEYLRRHGE